MIDPAQKGSQQQKMTRLWPGVLLTALLAVTAAVLFRSSSADQLQQWLQCGTGQAKWDSSVLQQVDLRSCRLCDTQPGKSLARFLTGSAVKPGVKSLFATQNLSVYDPIGVGTCQLSGTVEDSSEHRSLRP